MSREEVFSTSVERIEVMDAGDKPGIGQEKMEELYRQMMLARKFDEKAFSLQRRGDISTYAPHKGQEAAQVGAVNAMQEEDWMVPSFRETAAYMARGADLVSLFQRWMGDANGQEGLEQELPVAIPVGTQNPHAAGIGMAMEFRDEDAAALAFTGDGSTSQGDFYEALNFSGVYGAHTVFLVQNNRYAISMPVDRQTAAETLAQKAVAAGIRGIQVDGNDVLAVRRAVSEALEGARSGEPVLVEALTYRLEDHTTSDDSTRYRDEEEVEEWKEEDPVRRLEQYMRDHEMWTGELDGFGEEAERRIDEAAEEAKSMDDPEMEEMFDHVYSELPDHLEQQKRRWSDHYG